MDEQTPTPETPPPADTAPAKLNSIVHYWPRAVGLPRKGALSTDSNNIVLKDKRNAVVFSEPLSSVKEATRNEAHLYITFTDKKYRFLFGSFTSSVAPAFWAGSAMTAGGAFRGAIESEARSGLEDWVKFFSQKGIMGKNLSTREKTGNNFAIVRRGWPMYIMIALLIWAAIALVIGYIRGM